MNTETVATELAEAETVAKEIFKLNYRRSSVENTEKMAIEITNFAQEISTLLLEKGLKIAKGSTTEGSSKTRRSFDTIYLEPADGSASHNPNHGAYKKVVCKYKFLVYNKYGARPIALKTMRWLLEDLRQEVEKFGE